MSLWKIVYKLTDYRSIALFNFTVLVYISFFGTSDPFRYEASAFGSTNPFNQIIYSLLFLSSFILILVKRENIFNFIRKEKYFTIFIFYCLLSAVWADYPMISLRRSFQLLTVYQVILTSLLLIEFHKQLNVIKVIITLYTVVTAFAIMFIPDAIDPLFNSPRGLTLQKNAFGQVFIIIFILYLLLNQFNQSKSDKIVSWTGIGVSALFIVLSLSTTALITLLYIISLIFVFKVDVVFKDIKIGRSFSNILLITIVIFAIILSLNSDFLELVVSQYFGKDLTFTGRTEKWTNMIKTISNHFWFGVGYDAFWDVPGNLNAFYEIGNSAHNGFLEMFNELGLVGFFLMLFVFSSHFYRAGKIKKDINIIFLISILLLNLTESALFRQRGGMSFAIIWILLFNSFEYLRAKNFNTIIFEKKGHI